mmetsp:Transcript_7286/g.10691  ORF Transcript_7286/g.10691 Transcript_7286/m.10691 type:complete len:88 (+) Transcript_7286:32-295(+)
MLPLSSFVCRVSWLLVVRKGTIIEEAKNKSMGVDTSRGEGRQAFLFAFEPAGETANKEEQRRRGSFMVQILLCQNATRVEASRCIKR